MAEECVSPSDYRLHKEKCGKSFEDVFDQIGRLNRAMFGEEEIKQKGMLDMTKEMYESLMVARGGERVFWLVVKIAVAISSVLGTFWAIYEFVTRLKIAPK